MTYFLLQQKLQYEGAFDPPVIRQADSAASARARLDSEAVVKMSRPLSLAEVRQHKKRGIPVYPAQH